MPCIVSPFELLTSMIRSETSSPGPSKRHLIHEKERKVLGNVMSAMEKERLDKKLMFPLSSPTKRAEAYTGTPRRTLQAIHRELQTEGTVISPSKKRKAPTRIPKEVDSFDRNIIKSAIEEFYLVKKTIPSVRKLINELKVKMNFPFERTKLREILKEMGFRWKRAVSKRKILVERHDIIDWRCRYLMRMRRIREDNRNIFFLDESWIDSNLTFRKCWQGPGVVGAMECVSGSNRIIVVGIGSEEGFLPGAQLFFRADVATGDYHGQMNYDNFSKWVTDKVIPNLPANSVVIMDNAPYHSKIENKVPSRYDTKKTMVEWLTKANIPAVLEMRKPVLYELIEKNKPTKVDYKIDRIFAQYGHEVVRLPPYNCELNPIELIWAIMKRFVRENNVGDLRIQRLLQLSEEAIKHVTNEDWKKCCDHIKKLENEYWEKDGLMENALDQFVIAVSEEEDSEESGLSDLSED